MKRGSKPVAWMNLKGTKSNMAAEQGRIEFMENLNISFEQLKIDNGLNRSLHLLSLGKHRFNNGVLKGSRLIYVSENSHFSGHADTTGLINSKSSQKFHMSMHGSNDAIPGGAVDCKKWALQVHLWANLDMIIMDILKVCTVK